MAARSSTDADRHGGPRCVSCEYDLRGAVADADNARCPECGHELAGHGVASSRERRVLSSLGWRLSVWGAVGVLATAVVLVTFHEHALYIAPFAVLLLALGPVLVAAYAQRRLP